MDFILQPWPWYITGPLIGLMVPFLLIFGNKMFGISSTLRHICAACISEKPAYFNYDWRNEIWNLLFALGIIAGGFIAFHYLTDENYVALEHESRQLFADWHLLSNHPLVPEKIFANDQLLSLNGILFTALGGFLVGFGTRYANGCTSGHSIMGISQLSPASLIATIGFFIGGLIGSWLILPFLF